MKEMNEGNAEVEWAERVPYAYWKGSPFMGGTRQDLVKCNVTKERDWNARIYAQVYLKFSYNMRTRIPRMNSYFPLSTGLEQ